MKKQKLSALIMLVVFVMICCFTACSPETGDNNGNNNNNNNNNNNHVHAFANATCTTPATCECGATEGEALGHNYNSVVTAPTCTEKGYTTHTCTVCNDSYKSDEVATVDHSYNSVVTAPTCTEKGYTTHTCTVCNDSYKSDEVATVDHSYTSVVTAPTCSKKGYTTHTCTVCNHSYKSDEVATVDHSYTSKVTAPTCTKEGYTTHTCTVCKHSYTSDKVAALDHKYTSKVTAPTCTEDGYTTYTCSVCNHSYTSDKVAALDHKYTSEVTAPTCTEDGYTTHTCTVCNHSYKSDEVASSGHKYSSEVTAPTCTEKGYTTYTCSVCNHSYTGDETDALGHKCDSNGVCSGCNGELAVVNPVVGKGYLFGMTQKNLQNKVYYLKGGMNGYYMETTTDPSQALLVYLEEAEGGYYAYCVVDDVKTYINMAVSGTHVNGAYEATASTVYTIDEEHHTIIANVDGADYWFGTRNDKTYTTAGPCKTSFAGFYCEFYEIHVHDFVKGETVAPGCGTEGYTSYTCACGAVEKKDIVEALEHIAGDWEVSKEATCTAIGQKVIKCQREGCGEVIDTDEIAMKEHVYENGFCVCGKEDPDLHKHSYEAVVTAPTCTVPGYTTYTCACGDTYTADETEVVPHVDANLDITCDFEGCTHRILPPADSKISLFTANHMIIVSGESKYYVEGVVTEITDAKNGIFIIEDEAGDTILIRLPKNEAGTAYSSWTEGKVVVGDTVQVYGRPSKNSSTPTTQKAKVESGVLTTLKHEHSFSEPTCTEPGRCECLAIGEAALDHIDENGDNVCDRCPWKMNQALSHITIATDPAVGGVFSADQTYWTWSNDDFDAVIAKGTSTSTVYKTSKAYMQLKKGNTLTVASKNGKKMNSIVIYTTNATQLSNLVNAIGTAYAYTKDAEKLCVTIELDSVENFVLANAGTMTAYVSGVDIIYEK